MTVRRIQAKALLFAFGCVATFGFFPIAGAQAARHLSITPATGLGDQVVHLVWTGFNPANEVTVYQCKGVQPTSVKDCYTELRPPDTEFGTGNGHGTTGADGSGQDDFEVRPAPDLPMLGCSAARSCSILAFENDGTDVPANGLPGTAVTARLDFAPGPADCPKVSTPDVVTAGEGSAAPALYTWSARECTGSHPVSVDYTESSSPAGRDVFFKGLVDVGITSTAPTAPEVAAGTRHAFAEAPIDLTGVVVTFNVTDTDTHERITDMKLTPRLVAIMIAGGDSSGPGRALFTDPEFVALNPGHHWPATTANPLLRAERNADAYLLTSWLNADRAARNYLDGKDPTVSVDRFWKGISYPTDIFETRDPTILGAYNPLSGTLTNVRRMLNFLPPGDGVLSPQNDGLLGVLDVVTAREFGLPTAKLLPANAATGATFVGADAAGLLAGYQAMKTAPDRGTRMADPAAAGAYPLVKIDYALVPTAGITAAKKNNIASFLQFAQGDGQAAGTLSPGYVPLPAALRAQTTAARLLVLKALPNPATPPGSTPPPQTPSAGGSPGPSSLLANSSSLFGDAAGSSLGVGGATGSSGLTGNGSNSTSSGSPPAAGSTGGPGNANQTGTTPGGPSSHDTTLTPIGRFGGGEAQRVLPILLGCGLAALTFGPGLGFWARRQGRQRGKGPRGRKGRRQAAPVDGAARLPVESIGR